MEALQRALNLNRSVNFDCKVTIDQLSNVPLLQGQFKVKWKFSHPVHVEAQLRAKQVASSINARRGGGAPLTEDEPTAPWATNAPSTTVSSHSSPLLAHPSNSDDHPPLSSRRSIRSGITSPQPVLPDRTALLAHVRNNFSAPPLPSHTASDDLLLSLLPSRSVSPTKFGGHQPTTESVASTVTSRPESTGSTDYLELRSHNVYFRHTFHCPVSITLDRDGTLQPCILSMIIKEQHISHLGRREILKHGFVDIDLSQFTPLVIPQDPELDQTRIEKAKFLLKDCKTNASLKLQIQMDYISGATAFRIPKAVGEAGLEMMANLSAQQDDARSTYSSRRSNGASPESSIMSSGSSHRRREARKVEPMSRIPSSPSRPTGQSQQDINVQIADDVINLLFSNSYTPSSGPLSQRLQSARKNHNPKVVTSQRNPVSKQPSSDSTEPIDDRACAKSVRSFKSRLTMFNRSTSQLSTAI